MMVCTKCGSDQIGNLRFCRTCGMDRESRKSRRASEGSLPVPPSESVEWSDRDQSRRSGSTIVKILVGIICAIAGYETFSNGNGSVVLIIGWALMLFGVGAVWSAIPAWLRHGD